MLTIDENFLSICGDLPQEALASMLGVMAPLMLDAHTPGPPLHAAPGHCCILFAHRRAPKGFMQGFALPVRWVRGEVHSPSLPAALLEEAERVRDVLDRERVWTLALPELFADVSFAGLSVSAPSAWTSLAAALIVAQRGGASAPHVFASAAFVPGHGVEPVRQIHAKLGVLERLVERGVVSLSRDTRVEVFLPAPQLHEAQEAGFDRRMSLHAYPTDAPRPQDPHDQEAVAKHLQRVLLGHLQALDAQPALEDPYAQRLAWANRPHIALDPGRRDAFYERALLHDIAARLSPPRTFPTERAPVLVAAPSLHNTHLLQLAVSVFRPSKLIIPWKPADTAGLDQKKRAELNEVAGAYGLKPHIILIPNDADPAPDALDQWVVELLAAHHTDPSAPWVLDVTGGLKLMSALLLATAARLPDAYPVYLEHATLDEVNKPRIGSERYICLRALFSPNRRSL